MSILIVLIGILFLILLIGYFKLDTFISFVVVCIGLGLALGMPLDSISKAIQKGIGNTLGFLVIILGLGAMLGKLVADSGAAQRISDSLIAAFPNKYIQWALVLTGIHRGYTYVLLCRFCDFIAIGLYCGGYDSIAFTLYWLTYVSRVECNSWLSSSPPCP